jgi:hypothetical protein
MAIIAVNIEDQIEDGIISLLNADDYIIDNSIPVVGWFDTSTEITKRQVVVHANSATPSLVDENGEAQEYEVKVDLLQYIHNTKDETPNAETDTIYHILVGFIEQTTKSAIEATI